MNDNITCPFCDETDFDLVGLKRHLEFDCEVYRETPLPHYHHAKYVDDKLVRECRHCGRDLLDPVHLRTTFRQQFAEQQSAGRTEER